MWNILLKIEITRSKVWIYRNIGIEPKLTNSRQEEDDIMKRKD